MDRKRTILMLVIAALAICGSAVADPAPACGPAPAASFGVPEPLNLQTLNPKCCQSISSTPEATCDSVSWSPGRCEQFSGGGKCAWTCHCCKPISAQYSLAYCGQFDALGADRCNQVWQGTACHWTC